MELYYVIGGILVIVGVGIIFLGTMICVAGLIWLLFIRRRSSDGSIGFDMPLLGDPLKGALVGEARRSTAAAADPINESREAVRTLRSMVEAPEPISEKRRKHENAAYVSAQFFLRGRGAVIEKALVGIGSRKDRSYFLLQAGKAHNVLTLTPMGRHCVVAFEEPGVMKLVKRLFRAVQHPHILTTLDIDYVAEKETVVVLRPWIPGGSVVDQTHRANPQKEFFQKYRSRGTKLKDPQIARYGRQILEALRYLEKVGFPAGHLHSNNVLIDPKTQTAMLTDYENGFLNVIPMLQRFVTHFPDKDVNVLCFGYVLYEMGCGEALNRADRLEIPPHCSPVVRDILLAIFTDEKFDPLESVADLLKVPFFRDAQVDPSLSEQAALPPDLTEEAEELLAKVRAANIVGKDGVRSGPRFMDLDSQRAPAHVRRSRTRRAMAQELKIGQDSPASPMNPPSSMASPPRMATSPTRAPAPPPPSKPAAVAKSAASQQQPPSSGRSSLLESIRGFSKTNLSKAETDDRSGPNV